MYFWNFFSFFSSTTFSFFTRLWQDLTNICKGSRCGEKNYSLQYMELRSSFMPHIHWLNRPINFQENPPPPSTPPPPPRPWREKGNMVGTILCQFSGLPAPRFCRGKWLELFFICSLVSLFQGSLEGSGWNYFFQFYGLSVPRFSIEGSGWNYSLPILWSVCPKVLKREVVGTILHQFSGLCPKVP